MYDSNNIFARIIRKEIPADVIYENGDVLVFYDIEPVAPIHILIVPKKEYCSFDDFCEKEDPGNVVSFFKKIRDIAHKLGLNEEGYRLITNHGKNGSQTVNHFHMHLLGGKVMGHLLP